MQSGIRRSWEIIHTKKEVGKYSIKPILRLLARMRSIPDYFAVSRKRGMSYSVIKELTVAPHTETKKFLFLTDGLKKVIQRI